MLKDKIDKLFDEAMEDIKKDLYEKVVVDRDSYWLKGELKNFIHETVVPMVVDEYTRLLVTNIGLTFQDLTGKQIAEMIEPVKALLKHKGDE